MLILNKELSRKFTPCLFYYFTGENFIFYRPKHLISIFYTIAILCPAILTGISPATNSAYGDYSTDESGNVFMYINVIGHVTSPGTFLIYEGTDILTILAQAGGPLPGAKLNKIKVYRKDNDIKILNLDIYLEGSQELEVSFKPNDTIYVEQTIGSYILSKSTILNTLLTLINIYFTVDKNQ